jgi:hypothetical protein
LRRRALIADRKSKVKEGQISVIRKDKLALFAPDDSDDKLYAYLQAILQGVPEVVVAGIATVGRAVIQTNETDKGAPAVESL